MAKNILYIHSGDNWIAGSERFLLKLIDLLDSNKFKPFIICDQPAMAEEAESRKIPYALLKYHQFLIDYHYSDLNPFAYLATVKRIYTYLKKWNIDLVHSMNIHSIQFSLPAARLRKIPILAQVQGTFLKRSRVLSLAGLADKIIPCSQNIARPYYEMKWIKPKIEVIYNGLDLSLYSTDKNDLLKEKMGYAKNDIIIGTVAFLIKRKGVDTFVQAAESFRSNPNIKFIVVGTGPMMDELKTLIIKLKMESQIRLLGHREDIPELLRVFDVFCLFSTADPLPYSVMEALAAGLPVVATGVGGIQEMVQNGQNGFIVKPGETEAIKGAYNKLIESSELRLKMGRLSRMKAEKQFDIKRHIVRIQHLYEEQVKNR